MHPLSALHQSYSSPLFPTLTSAILRSKFCFVPRGDSPGSAHLYNFILGERMNRERESVCEGSAHLYNFITRRGDANNPLDVLDPPVPIPARLIFQPGTEFTMRRKVNCRCFCVFFFNPGGCVPIIASDDFILPFGAMVPWRYV